MQKKFLFDWLKSFFLIFEESFFLMQKKFFFDGFPGKNNTLTPTKPQAVRSSCFTGEGAARDLVSAQGLCEVAGCTVNIYGLMGIYGRSTCCAAPESRRPCSKPHSDLSPGSVPALRACVSNADHTRPRARMWSRRASNCQERPKKIMSADELEKMLQT